MKKILNYLKIHENAQAALLILLILAALFLPATISEKIFSASDILQNYPTFSSVSDYSPKNRLFSDPMSQFEPWYKFDIDTLKSGELPLWNPFQGNGTPQIANMQSAFFYPLSWLIFSLGLRWGLALLYFSKLFFIGFFTYLFLKEIGANLKASLTGTIAFMFSGYIANWLYWPHTNVIFFLPLSLFLIERIFRRGDLKYFLYFSIGLAIALFGGHPETFAHAFLVSILYFLFKFFIDSTDKKNKIVTALKFGTSSLLGFLLASIQLLPFLEYLANSQVYSARTSANTNFLPPQLFSMNIIPDLFGNQATSHYFLNLSNYNETTGGYIGLSMLFFAFLSLLYLYREKIILFFLGLALLSLAIVYKAPFVFSVFTSLPVFNKSANHRMLFIFSFSAVVLGTMLLSKIIDSKIIIPKKKFFVYWIVFATFVVGFSKYSINFFSNLIDNPEKYGAYLEKVIPIYSLDLILLLFIILFVKNKKLFSFLMAILVLTEMGFHFFTYEPAINKQLFFPRTVLTDFLENNLGNFRFVSVNRTAYLGPNMGSYYQISDIRNYDAMLVKNYSDSFNTFAPNESNWQSISSVNPGYLNLAGVKYIVAKSTKDLSQELSLSENDLSAYSQALKGKKFIVFENPNVLPRVFFTSEKATQKTMIDKNDLLPASEYQAEIVEYDSQRVTVATKNEGKATLVITDTFFPGWKAYVDGKEKNINETASSFRSVELEPGTHKVEFKYQPNSFRVGFWISLVAIFGVIYGFFLASKKRIECFWT